MRNLYVLCLVFVLASALKAHDGVVKPYVNPGLTFTENKGQWQSHILFRAGLDGGALFMEKGKLTYHFYDKAKARRFHGKKAIQNSPENDQIKGHAFHMIFEGCNMNHGIQKQQQGTFYENFFLGNDKTKWQSDVKNYHQIWYKDLYTNIDYEVTTAVNGIKYNFYVKPGGDPDNIKLKYVGVNTIQLVKGKLVIKPEVNQLIEQEPYAYQNIDGKIVKVECRFSLRNKTISYEFPNGYDKTKELIIDPLLIFAAQSGSTADNFGMSATYDAQGNLYSGGTVFNIGYPTTPGAYSTSFFGPMYYGNTDVVITKYNSVGTNLLYSTYFGGNYTEGVNSMIVDGNNNLCFYGATSSLNMPTTPGAYDATFNGGSFLFFYYNGLRFHNGTDIYIAKFNNAGTSLLASTYIGGSDNDGINHTDQYTSSFIVQATPPTPGNITVFQPDYDSLMTNYGDQSRGEIMVDKLNNIYVASSVRSTDFPTTNSFDNTLNGTQDGVLIKFDPSLSNLMNSSFIGGSSTDCANGLIVKDNFEVYVTGGTCSQNFPYATGGYASTYQGGNADAYVIRVNAAGNTVLNGTYFGTSSYDNSFFIQSDKRNNIYIYGQSLGNIPVVVAPTSTTIFSVTNTHQFISRFNATLNNLNMSTVFGNYTNSFDLSPAAFSVDKCNNIYLSGWGANFLVANTTMTNMPILIPTQANTDGHDFYFMSLDSNASALKYGSYFGGGLSEEHVDGGTSRFDPNGKIYQSVCAGCGGNDDFPVTPGAWPGTPGDPNHNTDNNNCNNGVIKIDFLIPLTVSSINTNTLSGCAPLTVNFTNVYTPTNTAATFTWSFGTGQTSTTNINPSFTYTNPGTYTVSLIIFDPSSCNKLDSTFTFITVLPKPTVAFTPTFSPCSNTVAIINNSTGTLSANPFVWNWGDATPTLSANSPTHSYGSSGVYTISLIATGANGCTSTATQTVSLFNFNPSVSSAIMCEGATATLNALGGTSYTWSPATGLSNSLIANPASSPSVTTGYTVTVLNNSTGFPCTSTLTTTVVVNPRPDAGFNYTMNPCGGGVSFFDTSLVNITSWKWYLAPNITSTVQNPYNFYSTGGTYTIGLAISNAFGCVDSIAKVITVQTPPPMSVNNGSTICKGNPANLFASGGNSYTWTPATGLSATNIANPVSTTTASTNYSVIITTSNNCSFMLTTFVNVFNLSNVPIAAASNPTSVVKGNSSTLTYTGDPGAGVSWFPSTSVNPKTGYSVIATPDRPTTYTVIAQNGACKETLYVFVDVFLPGCIEGDAFIPNTFTPNGDGQNDVLYVRGLKVDEVYFAVYNRWGEMVFETTDKTKGWDGIYKGRPADVGVFGWYLKVKCYNGEETFKKGNVTLIR